MKIDLAELRNIDFNDFGKWPLPVKVIAISLLCIAMVGAGFWFDTRVQLESLKVARAKEGELKETFKAKQHQAANLEAYKDQMEEMKQSFGTMLRQLPSKTEVDDLLQDVSQTALKNGLEIDLFKPESEIPAEFYAELPITIKMTGTYHEFGKFVSDVASLPRIVTLHDFSISPAKSKDAKQNAVPSDALVMEATAKTYRYLDDEEIAANEEANEKAKVKTKARGK
jgi:type IV pilus assembly protein PilO